jgi:hypothetical protein
MTGYSLICSGWSCSKLFINGRFIFDQAQELVFCLAAKYCIHQPDFQMLLMIIDH